MPFKKGFLEAIKPKENLTISEWADKYRILPSEGSAEPGRWRTSRTPYLKEIMDELSPQSPTQEVVVVKGVQLGFALSLDTPIATVDGWTTMRDIEVGEKIFDEGGNVCKVEYVSPIYLNHKCYEITFSDGNKIIADGGHRWEVDRYVGKTFKRFEKKIVSTEEMAKDYKVGNRNRYAISTTKPLQLPKQDLPLHPYLVGLWLGNGIVKKIPNIYLRSSEKQREYLFNGLMDSVKYTKKDKYMEFYNIDKYVMDYLFELAVSLGYAVNQDDSKIKIFQTYRRRVVGIRRVESVPVRCISVDSKSHLFLAGRFMTPTHNTELGNNLLFYYADMHPCPMLQVLHTEDIARTHAKTKIWPSIERMERLSSKIHRAKGASSGSSTTELIFPGGNWKLGWAQTKSTFASVSRRVAVGDDVDRWPLDVGGEGNPVELLKKRTDAFANRKIYINSTPTIKGESNIEKEFEESDKRHFFMPCPKCGEFITFERENFVYEFDEESFELLSDVRYKCPECGELIEEYEKTKMMQRGRWIAQNPNSSKVGYRLPSYYSPTGWLSWESIFREYLSAQREAKKGDSTYLKVWTNTRDAKTYEEKMKRSDIKEVEIIKREFEPWEVPQKCAFLTMAVDVQLGHFWVDVWAWLYGGVSVSIRHGRVENWSDVEDIMRYVYKDRDDNPYFIKCCAVDSGYIPNEVYEFCAMNMDIAIPIKGGSESMKNSWSISTLDNGLSLYAINVDYFKDMFWARVQRSIKALENGDDLQKGLHFVHRETQKWYFSQITAEIKITETDKKGRKKTSWQKISKGIDNHLFDTSVYNQFLGEYFGIRFLKEQAESVRRRVRKRRKEESWEELI